MNIKELITYQVTDYIDVVECAGDGMSSVMFENILKELSNLISENDLHVSQVLCARLISVLFTPHLF